MRNNKQSPDNAGGVNITKNDMDVAAGDQKIIFLRSLYASGAPKNSQDKDTCCNILCNGFSCPSDHVLKSASTSKM